MVQIEAKGGTKEVFAVQITPNYGETCSNTAYYESEIEDFVPEGTILLSSAPPTSAQIELGQRIAKQHGLTE